MQMTIAACRLVRLRHGIRIAEQVGRRLAWQRLNQAQRALGGELGQGGHSRPREMSIERLEPCEGKLSRTVLRGPERATASGLPGTAPTRHDITYPQSKRLGLGRRTSCDSDALVVHLVAQCAHLVTRFGFTGRRARH